MEKIEWENFIFQEVIEMPIKDGFTKCKEAEQEALEDGKWFLPRRAENSVDPKTTLHEDLPAQKTTNEEQEYHVTGLA